MESIAIEIVKFLGGEVASNALQRLLPNKSLEEKVTQALGKALDEVARGNEIWKEKVVIQKDDVIEALVWMVDSPKFSDPPTNLFDKKLLIQFKTELEKDANTWAYLQILLLNYRIKKSNEKNEREIQRLNDKINELLQNVNANIRFLTSVPAWADVDNVIGREKDLDELWKRLSNKKHVMLTGLGGIGKTKMAQLLFHNYRDRFEEVAWIGYKGSLRKSFLYRIEDYRDRNDPWEAMMNDLHNDGKTKLFIIDNVDDDTNQNPLSDKELRNLTGWENTTILLTSRLKEELRPYFRYELKALGKDDCIAVFNRYYESEPDPELVGNIVALAHYHTFTIELLAKSAKRENLASYYETIKKGFEEIERQIHSEYDDENATIEWHLRCLFNIQKRSDADKKVLNSFAVLPVNCECSLEEIWQWFGFENRDLDDLIQDGWLSYDEGKQPFSMHPLVRTIVRFDFADDAQGHKKTIAPEGTADKLIDYVLSHKEELFNIDNSFSEVQRMFSILDSAFDTIDKKNNTMYSQKHSEYLVCYLKYLDAVYKYYREFCTTSKELIKCCCERSTKSFNDLAVICYAAGQIDEALSCRVEALKLWLSIDIQDSNAKTIFENLIFCYQAANKEKDFVEWLKEQLNEKEWAALLELVKSL